MCGLSKGERRNRIVCMITVFGNLKGGTGKSTVAFNIAAYLAAQQQPLQLFDLDPQATLADLIDIRREEGHQPAMAVERQAVKLSRTTAREVLVDVGTSDMPALRLALNMADRVVTPVPPSQADIWSLQRFISIVREANLGSRAPEHLCFINRANPDPAAPENAEARAALQQLKSVHVIDAIWCDRPVYREAFSEGLAAFELEPQGPAHSEVMRLSMILYSHLFVK